MRLYKIIAILSLAVLFSNISSYAEDTKKNEDKKMYISIDLTLPVSSVMISEGYDLDHPVDRSSGLDENDAKVLGLGMSYDFFAVNSEFSVFDGTMIYDFTGSMAFNRIVFELMMQKYRGYYFEDDEAQIVINPDGTYKVDKDFTTTSIRLNSYFFINDDFSYNDAYMNITGVTGFKWSPFIKVSPGYFKLHDDTAIIPAEKELHYDKSFHKMTKLECYNTSISGGVAVIIPIWRFYFSPILSLGYERFYYSHNGKTGWQHGWGNYSAFDFKFLLAYTDNTISFGYSFCNENQSMKIKGTMIQVLNMQSIFFAGVRF